MGVGVALWASYFFSAALERVGHRRPGDVSELWSMTWLAVDLS